MEYDINTILLRLHSAGSEGVDPKALFGEGENRSQESEREILNFILGEGLASLPDKQHIVLTPSGIEYCESLRK